MPAAQVLPSTIPADNKEVEAALLEVNLPVLLQVMAQLDCANPLDSKWLGSAYTPEPIMAPEGSLIPDDSGGYSDAQASEIRAGALELLIKARDNKQAMPAIPDLEVFQQMMAFSIAEPMDLEYAKMLQEETGFVNRDQQWQTQLPATIPDDFFVLIVGAGMSGLGMAAKLKDAGIAFEILEKNEAVGGTWYENRYPDCGVDTPNHFYSYSFNRNPDWSGYFSKRDELYAYFEKCADDFGVRGNIRFGNEVTHTVYDAQEKIWRVSSRTADGTEVTRRANVLVSAVGQLNRPMVPDLKGADSFQGAAFHSARWQDLDLTGKRVGVIGTGCSAVQLLPKTADKAEHVSVFQRTPHWVSPVRDYYRKVEDGTRWALRHIPWFAEWHRARMVFGFADRNWDAVCADPDWMSGRDADEAQRASRAMNEMSDGMRVALTEYIKDELGDKQHLAEHCTPDFPVWGKRLIIDNGWYNTLARDDVSLVTSGINEIVPKGIRSEDGKLHKLDVLIYATGFQSNLFLWPMEVVGKTGESLDNVWGDDPEAYVGITVPDYPNLFCLYGPNTNIVHGGSIIYQVECQIHYVMQCITAMCSEKIAALEVRSDVNEKYNERVQEISRGLAWGHAGVSSWYKNSSGKVVNNSPFSLHQYWQETHDLELADYEQAVYRRQ